MGSTGHGIYQRSNTGNVNNEVFGIARAVNFKGRVPDNSGLETPGDNKVTLKLPTITGDSVIFQFKLNKSGDKMTIIGYKDGVPEVKSKVQVDSTLPSLDKVIASGSKSEKINAVRMKDLFAKSTNVKEYQLAAIANKLLQHKRKRREN